MVSFGNFIDAFNSTLFAMENFNDLKVGKKLVLDGSFCLHVLDEARTTRSSTYSHPFQVTLPNPRTLSHKSSFIPRTSQLWNTLPPTTFPESYNLSSFKSNINKLILSPFLLKLPFIFSVFPLSGLCYRPTAFPRHYLLKKGVCD